MDMFKPCLKTAPLFMIMFMLHKVTCIVTHFLFKTLFLRDLFGLSFFKVSSGSGFIPDIGIQISVKRQFKVEEPFNLKTMIQVRQVIKYGLFFFAGERLVLNCSVESYPPPITYWQKELFSQSETSNIGTGASRMKLLSKSSETYKIETSRQEKENFLQLLMN